MQAKDVMVPDVVTVGLEAKVKDIADLLVAKQISAIPVVDKDGKLAGIVSEGDLLRRMAEGADDKRPWWLRMMATGSEDASAFIKSHGRTAEQVMTKNVVTVEEDADLSEVAHLLESNRIKRVPVMRDGQVVGIVSRSNLLQVIAGQKMETKKTYLVSDREIREQVHKSLSKKDFVSHGTLNVIVDDGIVELWGWVESDVERDALVLAASEVDGVKEVKDHFGRISPWVWGT